MAGSMIELRCLYCGGLVRAEDSGAYHQVPCPACGHSLPVRRPEPGDPGRGGSPMRNGSPNDTKDWTGKSNKEIAEQLLTRRRNPEDADAWALKMLLSPLLPQCDDLSLFAVSVAFLLLVLLDGTMRQDLLVAFHALGGTGAPLLFLLQAFGMVCSLVGVFVRRKKPPFVKWAMLVFAICVTGGTGVYAGWLMLGRTSIWLMIFPAWNILNGLALLMLFRARVVDTKCILDEKTMSGQVVIAVLAVFMLLTTCRYLFGLRWAPTLSIVVAYTMNLHHVLRHRITGRPGSGRGGLASY